MIRDRAARSFALCNPSRAGAINPDHLLDSVCVTLVSARRTIAYSSPNQGGSFMRIGLLVTAALIMFGAGASLGATHPLFRPVTVSSSIKTYRDSQVVGPVLFSLAPIPREEPAPKGLITNVTFPAGQAPELNGRVYLPASVEELLASVGSRTRNVKLRFTGYLKDRGQDEISQTPTFSDKEQTWTALGWSGQVIRPKMAKLSAGKHKFVLWVSLAYEYQRPHPKTGELEWVADSFTVGKGELDLDITESDSRR
ncbi:MAG TPA: hypothetical protein VK607_19165 [Kofleriaceae bacterium]|nr:hypothetical protein [Kofleriaceae bacterium]